MMKYFDATTSDKNIIKADILRDFVYLKAEELFIGKYLTYQMPIPALDIRFDVPMDTKIDPDQVSEGALADLKRLGFYQINTSQDKYQTRILVTDETKARQLVNNQISMSLDAAGNGLANAKDDDIFTVLGAGAGNTQAASGHWDDNGVDLASDIANAIGKIIDSTTLTDQDMNNMVVAYPAKLWGHLSKPVQIGEIQMTFRNWAEREYKIRLMPTRKLTTTALCVVQSPQTALHMTYSGNAVPTSEFKRLEGVGDEWLITQYFKTLVIPYAKNQTTSKRICTLTGVCT